MGRYSDMLLNTADEPQARGRYSEQLLGSGEGSEPAKAKTGPREQLPSVYSQFPRELENPMGMAATAGASDAQMGDIVQKNLGDRFVRREPVDGGYEVFVTRGQDGQEQRGYLNQPGFDSEDLVRGVRGALPYVATGGAAGVATRGAGLGLQALTQAGTAAATSIAGDVAQMPMGSEQGIEVDKAGVMGAFGAAGPVVGSVGGALWRRFVTIPGLVDETTGQLTAKGIDAARRAGVDPADITPDFSKEFARSYARSGNEMSAATEASARKFNIPATRGQVTKDPYLLTQEEGMRRRLYGEQAQNTMLGFDKRQSDAIAEAALGQTGIANKINPVLKPLEHPFDRIPGNLGEGVKTGVETARSGAKALENEAWKGTRDLAATKEAFDILPDVIGKKVANVTIDERLTPAAARMGQEIDAFISGEAPGSVAGVFKQKPITSLDQMRRRLLAASQGAATPEDTRAAKAVYDGFNDWIGEAARQNLLSGDPAAAMNIVKARGFTKEVRELFAPRNPDGSRSAAGARLKKIENADSGEAVIQALFGAQGTRGASEGTVQALTNLKGALDRFAPADIAKASWDDVRLAYWSRLVTGKNGELLGPTAMMNNIKSALSGQRSVINALYVPLEVRDMAQFVRALETVSYKPPNASGSGYTAASFAKEGILKLLDTFGLGTPARAAIDYSRVGHAVAGAQARNAVSQFTRPVRPNVTPAITAGGQAYERSR